MSFKGTVKRPSLAYFICQILARSDVSRGGEWGGGGLAYERGGDDRRR